MKNWVKIVGLSTNERKGKKNEYNFRFNKINSNDGKLNFFVLYIPSKCTTIDKEKIVGEREKKKRDASVESRIY